MKIACKTHINYTEGLYGVRGHKKHCALTAWLPPGPAPLPLKARTAGTHTRRQLKPLHKIQHRVGVFKARCVLKWDSGSRSLAHQAWRGQRPVPATLGAEGAKTGGQRQAAPPSATSRLPGQACREVLQHWILMQQGGQTPPIPFKARAMPATPPRENADDLASRFTRATGSTHKDGHSTALGGAGGGVTSPGGAPTSPGRAPGAHFSVAEVSHGEPPQS